MKKVFPLLILAFSCAWPQIRFSANVDRTTLSTDEFMTVSIQATGKDVDEKTVEPTVPPLEHFRLVDKKASVSSSSSMRIVINGRDMSKESEKTVNWDYVLAPTKGPGQFRLPSFVLNYQGKSYQTNPISITVTGEKTENTDVLFQCLPEKRTVYVGEQFRCVFRIAIRRGANAFNPKRPMVEDELRKFFWVEEAIKGDIAKKTENVNGAAYDVFDIPFALYAVQAGSITIPSFTLQYEEHRRVQGRNPFFDDPFFNGIFGGGVQANAKQKISKPVLIQAKELPSPPSDFSGSVGEFTLNARIDRSEPAVGDALTFTLVLSGNSSLRSIRDPVLPPLNGFDVFEPEKKTQTQIRNSTIFGSREYKYVLIPQTEGARTIEPVRYVYYDAASREYRTLSTEAFPIRVLPGKPSAVAAEGRRVISQREIKELGTDIRFIKTGNIVIGSAGRPLHRNPLYLGMHFVAVMAVAASFLFQKQRRKLIADRGYARRARSKKQVRKRLSEAGTFLGQSKGAEFYGSLANGILSYIGDILNVEAAGMTREALRSALDGANLNEEQMSKIFDLLEKADFARFAASGISTDEMRQDMVRAEEILNHFGKKK